VAPQTTTTSPPLLQVIANIARITLVTSTKTDNI